MTKSKLSTRNRAELLNLNLSINIKSDKMKTHQMKAEILQLGQVWKNATKTEKANIADKIGDYFLNSPEEQIPELLEAVRSLAWLNEASFDRVVKSLKNRAEIKKIMPLTKRQNGQRHKLAQRHLQLLEKEFLAANFNDKVIIFKEANTTTGNEELEKVNHAFCSRHWEFMVDCINNLEKGLSVYRALVNHSDTKEIWPTVAAVKTIRLWGKQESIQRVAQQQHKILSELNSSLNPGKILIAQMILNKM